MTETKRYIVGVDVGGTFTDLFFLNETDGIAAVGKVPTTRPDQARGIIDGLKKQLAHAGDASTIVHGTTVATNALLERKGGTTGLITTAGFRDVLEMRRRDRPRTWGLWGDFEPVVPRDRRLEVSERTLANGTVRTAVDTNAAVEAARLLQEAGADAVAVFFVNSYANGENEAKAAQAIRDVWPNAFVNASSEILPEIREFERCSTTVLNAYLQPVVAGYLERLDTALRSDGFAGQLLIVQSNGGVMTVDTAQALPMRTALSGPAAGVIASAHIAESAGFANVVTCDMGGTSFDVAVISGGRPTLAAQSTIDFGMVLRTPMIEITTIGAGGGSIAWVDAGNMLQIGPESAGSDPGPVCYGAGNDQPTVTDANVVLGRINAEKPIGGGLSRLDQEAATAAIEGRIAKPLGLGTMEAAEAIIRVANSKMAGAIRLVSIERGHDPADFAAVSFGGAGSLHIGALIDEVGLASALIPRFPGVTSALGCVVADMRHDYVHTINRLLSNLDVEGLAAEMRCLAGAGLEQLHKSHAILDGQAAMFELDMSYVGQTHTLPVRISVDDKVTNLSVALIRQAFEMAYEQAFGRLLDGIDIRILNLRVAAVGRRPKFDLAITAPTGGSLEAAQLGERRIWIDGGWRTCAIFDRLALPVGARVAGPAVLEQPDTTVLIAPGQAGVVDELGNIIIRREA